MPISWRFITENQSKNEAADHLARLLSEVLGSTSITEINKYDKFSNSYSIRLVTTLNETRNLEKAIFLLLIKANSICGHWTIHYSDNSTPIEMIFNKQIDSIFGKQNFNVIKWGHATLEM